MDQRSLVMGESRIRNAVRTYHDLQSMYQKILANLKEQFSHLDEKFECQQEGDATIALFDGVKVKISFDYITNHTETLMGLISFSKEVSKDDHRTILMLFFDEHGNIGTTPIRGEGVISFESKILCRCIMRDLLEAYLKSKHKVPTG
ncbi:hypothetical protein [Geomonas sp.]|uniref:hypothetical protein n=1 Tax=Geomonas sp. TaxID=2651584 RepID=UPI002B45DCBB|nr:hypothetical protein [Geomonas sp.]HJV37149.1 hypothetical protein [Geomonas sp.]